MASDQLPLREHPEREALVLELHARPYQPLEAPELASHIVMLGGPGPDERERDRLHVRALCSRFGAPEPAPGTSFHSVDLGAFRLRWERHGEFSSYSFFRAEDFAHPFETPVAGLLPRDWLEAMPGEMIAGVHVALESARTPERSREELARLFSGNTFIGCRIAGGAGIAWSDLRLHDDRFSRILVRDVGMTQRQAGRHIQRLLEIHAYRQLALLALPEARRASPRVHDMEARLATAAARQASPGQEGSDARLLDDLSALAAEIEHLVTATATRFAASGAYFDLVQERLDELRESRIEGLQTFSEFLGRHLTPAMRTCRSVSERLRLLSERSARIASLLRARVEVVLEQRNRDLLESMNRRARLQVRLQETVEGLSVVAISYYLVGLIGYGLKAIKAGGMAPADGFNVDIGTGIAVPLVALLVWLGLKGVRARIKRSDAGENGPESS